MRYVKIILSKNNKEEEKEHKKARGRRHGQYTFAIKGKYQQDRLLVEELLAVTDYQALGSSWNLLTEEVVSLNVLYRSLCNAVNTSRIFISLEHTLVESDNIVQVPETITLRLLSCWVFPEVC